jgi:hypothetical protein
MRQIEDYQFENGELEVWTYDDETDLDTDLEMKKTIISMETIQDVYEDIYGNDYLQQSYNATRTDVVEHRLCEPGEEVFFIQDQMCTVMTSKEVQEIINQALNKTGIPL